MKPTLLIFLTAVLAWTAALHAQTSPPAIYGSAASLQAQSRSLLTKAEAATDGNAGVILEKFDNYYTMLTVRVKGGGAEYHEHWSDIFVVISGEGTLVTGGTIPDMKQKKPGEYIGTKITGGTTQVLKAGDTFYIPPRTPHQSFVNPSTPFIYYVIKIHD
jgi:mannose-6-phosphate isomerase-like protein (cupin superfamily)